MTVAKMTDQEVYSHQQRNWNIRPEDSVTEQALCRRIQRWDIDRYRAYLEKVEARQGNITDGFDYANTNR